MWRIGEQTVVITESKRGDIIGACVVHHGYKIVFMLYHLAQLQHAGFKILYGMQDSFISTPSLLK